MNIVILGAGTVGTSVASVLCGDQHNVSVVDISHAALNAIEEQLDVQTVHGSPCDAITLFQAGVPSADLCLAVTDKDELNLVGASMAGSMGSARTIARIFDPAYLDRSTFDYQRHFSVDRLISLEHLTALELAKLIQQPSLFAVETFARGGIEVQEIAAEQHCKGVGVPLKELKLPREVRIGLISNGRGSVIAGANDQIQPGDHVTLIGEHDQLAKVRRQFEHRSPAYMSIIIAGGGQIGYSLARLLHKDRFRVTIMETDPARCQFLSEKLRHVTVLNVDATLRTEMAEARVGRMDVFVAATGHDADNIICAVVARELGTDRVMTVVRRPDYAEVLKNVGIDYAVSPREVLEHLVLGYVNAGPIIARSDIADGDAEIWEIEVVKGSPVTEATLQELSLSNCLIAAIIRQDYIRVPGANDQLRAGDSVVVLVQKPNVRETLKLFLHR